MFYYTLALAVVTEAFAIYKFAQMGELWRAAVVPIGVLLLPLLYFVDGWRKWKRAKKSTEADRAPLA